MKKALLILLTILSFIPFTANAEEENNDDVTDMYFKYDDRRRDGTILDNMRLWSKFYKYSGMDPKEDYLVKLLHVKFMPSEKTGRCIAVPSYAEHSITTAKVEFVYEEDCNESLLDNPPATETEWNERFINYKYSYRYDKKEQACYITLDAVRVAIQPKVFRLRGKRDCKMMKNEFKKYAFGDLIYPDSTAGTRGFYDIFRALKAEKILPSEYKKEFTDEEWKIEEDGFNHVDFFNEVEGN